MGYYDQILKETFCLSLLNQNVIVISLKKNYQLKTIKHWNPFKT